MSQLGQQKRPPKHYLRSIYPSKDMMEDVEAIIAREQQNPTHEQTAESPTGKDHLSSLVHISFERKWRFCYGPCKAVGEITVGGMELKKARS